MLSRRNLWMLPAAIAAASIFVTVGAILANGVPKIFSDETALATPGVGFSTTILARGNFEQNYTFGTPVVTTITRKVRIKPCDTAFQQARVEPRGSSGWHTHLGATFVAVVQGEGTLYRVVGSGCTATKITAGTGFAQMPTELHVVRNEGSVPFIVDTLYVLPHGTPNTGIRVDQPQPSACPSIN